MKSSSSQVARQLFFFNFYLSSGGLFAKASDQVQLAAMSSLPLAQLPRLHVLGPATLRRCVSHVQRCVPVEKSRQVESVGRPCNAVLTSYIYSLESIMSRQMEIVVIIVTEMVISPFHIRRQSKPRPVSCPVTNDLENMSTVDTDPGQHDLFISGTAT